jgi:hypothetical protein
MNAYFHVPEVGEEFQPKGFRETFRVALEKVVASTRHWRGFL